MPKRRITIVSDTIRSILALAATAALPQAIEDLDF
jgi:hypothetical protein